MYKIFKDLISKGLLVVFLTVGFSGSLWGEQKCNTLYYHTIKGEFNLDIPINNKLNGYSNEIFAAAHIYSIDKLRDIGEEFQFGKKNKAILIDYENNNSSGFTVGTYLINNNKLVIAFGGTTANEEYSNTSAIWNDIASDLKLLQPIGEDSQVREARNYIDKFKNKINNIYKFTFDKISIAGHSLGGGLAQYANMYSGYNTVTLNPAPNPLTKYTSISLPKNNKLFTYNGNNIINIMARFDWLTNLQKDAEFLFKGIETISWITSKGLKYSLIIPKTIKNRFKNAYNPKKLIYGQRVILDTGIINPFKAHSSSLFIKQMYLNSMTYNDFEETDFIDINKNSKLACNIIELLKNHSISYPKKDRGYKFYPNEKTNASEVSIFIVNTFLYEDFRKANDKNKNLTRFKYLLQNFPYLSVKDKNSIVSVRDINHIMRSIYIHNINKQLLTMTINTSKYKKVKKLLLYEWDNFGTGNIFIKDLEDNPNEILTRKDIVNKVVGIKKNNWYRLINNKVFKVSSNLERFFEGLGKLPRNLFGKGVQ